MSMPLLTNPVSRGACAVVVVSAEYILRQTHEDQSCWVRLMPVLANDACSSVDQFLPKSLVSA